MYFEGLYNVMVFKHKTSTKYNIINSYIQSLFYHYIPFAL